MRFRFVLLLAVLAAAALFLALPPRTTVQIADGVRGLVDRAERLETRRAVDALESVRRDLAGRLGAAAEGGVEAARDRLAAAGEELSLASVGAMFRRVEGEIRRLERRLGEPVGVDGASEEPPGAVLLYDAATGRGWLLERGRVTSAFPVEPAGSDGHAEGWYRRPADGSEVDGAALELVAAPPDGATDGTTRGRLRLVADPAACGPHRCLRLPAEALPGISAALDRDAALLVAGAAP